MRTNKLICQKTVLTAVMLAVSTSSFAGAKIEISNGATWHVAGGNLTLTCEDVMLLKSGGKLIVSGGKIAELNLMRNAGSNFIRSGGTVIECGSFYIIPGPDGKSAIIVL